jgi:HipA-like C-terminal domain
MSTPLPTIIDVANWSPDDLFATYPEGARDKRTFFPPGDHGLAYIKPTRRYMFKLSDQRYPEQYWSEIVAYAIGQMMGVPVPPAYPAIDSTRGESAALIEWFYEDGAVSSILGGRFMERRIPGFDSKRGKQHNFKTIRALFYALQKRSLLLDPNWLRAWTKGLMFDAMIGNTDRHQNNWALVLNQGLQIYELAPWFDNGTSLGHERWEEQVSSWSSTQLDHYLYNGKHHLRWERTSQKRCGFFELPGLLINLDPTLRDSMLGCVMAVDIGKLEEFMQHCTSLQCSVPLSPWRAEFMLRLVKRRQALFLEQLS